MKRSVELLGGGVLGFVLGTLFLAHPLASAVTTYARATWSLAGCPAGVYTLAATAQSLSGGPSYTLSTSVQVPQVDVVQQFRDVVPGLYTISASLRRANGEVVGSGSQVVSTTEEGVVTTTTLRSRTPSQPVIGIAAARRPQAPPATPSVTAPAPAVTSVAVGPADRTAAPRLTPNVRTLGRLDQGAAAPREWLIADLIRLSDPDGDESGWHQVQLLDLDGDGVVDEIRIEPPNGTAVVWHLVPQRLFVR
jgi:hypothetical protein